MDAVNSELTPSAIHMGKNEAIVVIEEESKGNKNSEIVSTAAFSGANPLSIFSWIPSTITITLSIKIPNDNTNAAMAICCNTPPIPLNIEKEIRAMTGNMKDTNKPILTPINSTKNPPNRAMDCKSE